MIELNYNNLDERTQTYLYELSKKDVERRYGEQLWAYAIKHDLDYDELVKEETLRNLYNYRYVFKV